LITHTHTHTYTHIVINAVGLFRPTASWLMAIRVIVNRVILCENLVCLTVIPRATVSSVLLVLANPVISV